MIPVGPQAAIADLNADLTVRDAELQAIPLRLEAGARIERLNWALDGQGRELSGRKVRYFEPRR